MVRKPPTTVVPPPQQLILGLPPWVVVFGILSGLHAIGFLVVKAYGAKPPHKDANLPAHFLPQLVGFIALAYQGLSLWFTMPSDISNLEAYYAPGEMVSATMMGFQLYELLACIPTPRLRGPGLGFEMIMHHLIAGGLGCLSYFYGVYHYYALFFMGVIEVSSIPLAFVDFFKHYPSLKQQQPAANELARNLFAPAFIICRTIGWPYVSFFFWRDSLAALSAPDCAIAWIIYIYFVCNVVMTLLQWFWSSLILKAIYFKATGDARAKEA